MIDPHGQGNLKSQPLYRGRSFVRWTMLLGAIPALVLVQCAGDRSQEGESPMTLELTSPAVYRTVRKDGSEMPTPGQKVRIEERTKAMK